MTDSTVATCNSNNNINSSYNEIIKENGKPNIISLMAKKLITNTVFGKQLLKDKKQKKHLVKGELENNFYRLQKYKNIIGLIEHVKNRVFTKKISDFSYEAFNDYLMNDGVKNVYSLKDIYIIQYKGGEEVATSDGIINEIKKEEKSYSLFHTCNTETGYFVSPIFLYNHKVIGVQIGCVPGDNYNKATLLQYPIKEYYKKLKQEIFNVKRNYSFKKDKINITKKKDRKSVV